MGNFESRILDIERCIPKRGIKVLEPAGLIVGQERDYVDPEFRRKTSILWVGHEKTDIQYGRGWQAGHRLLANPHCARPYYLIDKYLKKLLF